MPRTSSSSSGGQRYNLGLNPPYQINYRAKRAGKHISASKRRITFQFGFSSASAIKSGRTEVECRGEEHEVVLIWSHMTGKRQLYMDGREIHMSKAARGNTRFEYSWGIGSHVLKIIANGTPQQHQRQFDLELDGMSYFDFAKIYELGGRSNSGVRSEGRSASPVVGYSYRGLAYEERDDDLVDDDVQSPPMPEVKVTSLDLFDTQPSIMSPMTNFSSVPSLVDSASYSNSNSSFDEFAPVDMSNQRSFDSISKDILSGYNTTAAPAAKDTPSTCTALVPVSEEQVDVITKSMKNIVNLDDITTGPVKPLAAPGAMNKQKSLPSWALVGRQPTLAELRATQSPTMATNVMKQQPAQQMYHQAQQHAMYQQSAPAYGYNYGPPNNAGYARAY